MDSTAQTIFNAQILIPLVSGLTFFLLFVVVLNANARSAVNRSFAWYMLFNSIWALGTFLLFLNVDPSEERIIILIQRGLGVLSASVVFLIFSLLFLKKNPKWFLLSIIPTQVVYFFIFAYGLIVSVADADIGAYGPHGRLLVGPLYTGAVIYSTIIGALPVGLFLLELSRKIPDKIYHSKVVLLLTASVIGTLSSIFYNVTPALWVYPIDTLGSLISVLILVYAILRFEVVDVNTFFRNSLVHTVFTSVILAVYMVVIFGLQNLFVNFVGIDFWWFAFILAIMVGMIVRPVNDFLIHKLDQFFYRERYDYRQTLVRFASSVGEVLDLAVISSTITKVLKETMNSKFLYLYVDDGSGTIRSVGDSPTDIEFDRKDELVKNLKSEERVLTFGEASKYFKDKMGGIPERVSQLKAELTVPLKIGGDLAGIAFVGPRLSGDFYTQEDTNLLFTLARPAAIALKNARLYQEVLRSKEEIERLYEHDKEVQQLKDQFVMIASHELRTPLTSIKGYAEFLKSEKLNYSAAESITNMFVGIKRLESLTEELVKVASIEKGELKPTFQSTNLTLLVHEVAENEKSSAESKKIKLNVMLSPTKIENIKIDPNLVRYAINSLVDNAIKFTNKGSVDLMVVKKLKELVIMVKDTGPGIAKEKQKLLFQRFSKGAEYTGAQGEGYGLGLYLTKLAVEANKGTINFETGAKGTTFTVKIPM